MSTRSGSDAAALDLFRNLCSAIGYRPDAVLSVRATARKVVEAFVDEGGELRKAVHPPVLGPGALGTPTSPRGLDE
jgi:hypothetical protein